MPGPKPKPAALRQRRNKASTRTQLPAGERATRRPLPRRKEGWRPETRKWWEVVWASPMAQEYVEADAQGLLMLAAVVDQYWRTYSVDLLREIRLQSAQFGLTPLDRRRLQWEMDRGEEAEAKRRDRASRAKAPSAEKPKKGDPRNLLRMVK